MSGRIRYVLGLLFVAGCSSSATQKSTLSLSDLPTVRKWKDLLEQPPLEVEEGVQVRFGIEGRTSPAGTEVLIYCLTEGFSEWTTGYWNDRLGPLRISVAEGDGNEPKLREAVPLPKMQGDKNAVLLFVHAIHLVRSVNYRVALFTDEGRLIAASTVRGTEEFFHPWLAWDGDPGWVNAGSITRVIDATALPAWRDRPVYRSRREDLIAHQGDRLPHMPESPDPGFHIRIEKDLLILVSDVDLWILRPYEYLLMRWWLNGKPYVPPEDKGTGIMTHNGAYDVLRNLDLRLLFKPADIGAKSGDRVDLQVLYCSDGWDWVTNDLELRWPAGPGTYERPPVFLLSNRAGFVVP